MVSALRKNLSSAALAVFLMGGFHLFLPSTIISLSLAQVENVSPQQAQFQSYVNKANGYLERGKLKKAIKAFRNALKYGDHPLVRLKLAQTLPKYYADSKEAEAVLQCQVLGQQGYAFLSKFCTASYSLQVYQTGLLYGAHYYRLRTPYLGRAQSALSQVIDTFQDLPGLTDDENLALHKGALEEYATILLYGNDAASALYYIKQTQALVPEDVSLNFLEASALSKEGMFLDSEMIVRDLIAKQVAFPDPSSFQQKATINSYKTVLAYTLVRQEKHAEALVIFDEFEDKSFTKFYIDSPFYAAVAAFEMGRQGQAEKYVVWAEEGKTKRATGGKATFNFEKPNLYSQAVPENLLLTLHGKILVAQGRQSEAAQLAPNNPSFLASLNQDTPLMAQASGQAPPLGSALNSLNTPIPQAGNARAADPALINGERRRWLGVTISGAIAKLQDKKTGEARNENAILVTGVEHDGPAHMAGILKGDKIIAGFGGEYWPTPADFVEDVNKAEINYKANVVIARENVTELILAYPIVATRDQSLSFRKALFAYWNLEKNKATALMMRAVETGNVEALFWMGVIYNQQKNPEEAFHWYLRAAEQGHIKAQYRLGLIYSLGKGTPEDDVESAKWMLRAAEQGHELAQSSTAGNYSSGNGVPQDYTEAHKWHLIQAENGSRIYQNAVGRDFEKGVGVPLDLVEAAKWYRLSADQGFVSGQFNLGRLYENGEGVTFQSYTRAVEWYKKSADQGDWSAQNRLGEMYEQGLGIPENYVMAFMWFNLLAAKGSDKAVEKRDVLRKKMTPDQIAEGQKLASEWYEEH